jgi:putative ABC transport system ATP-binding protein
MAMIELRQIRKTYQKANAQPVHALDGVSLDIDEGEFVAIVGASGSGKSTLMSVLGLLDRPTSGQYRFHGRDVSTLGSKEQARVRNEDVGFVFQAFHLLPRATAIENVELPLVYSDRDDIDGLGERALQRVGLGDRLTHTPSELSGGQQQRVAIARALVTNPNLLLADEPTGNLDPTSAADILAMFADLNRQGCTVVLVTHDANVARHCRRHIRLVDGRVHTDAVATIPVDQSFPEVR